MDNFNTRKVVLKSADDIMPSNLYVSEHDQNGRILRVQITDNGNAIDTTGYSLKLGFRTSLGTEGLCDFVIKDITIGLYELAYPTSMNVPGEVQCEVYIYYNGNLTVTKPCTITVGKSVIDEGAVTATNDFSTLQTALINIADLETNYIPRLQANEQNILDIKNGAIAGSLQAQVNAIDSALDLTNANVNTNTNAIAATNDKVDTNTNSITTINNKLLITQVGITYNENVDTVFNSLCKSSNGSVNIQAGFNLKADLAPNATIGIGVMPDGYKPVAGGVGIAIDINTNFAILTVDSSNGYILIKASSSGLSRYGINIICNY